MTDFFTHNAPDFGEEDGVMGPPGTSIADRLRRAALLMTMTTQRVWQDPLHTLFPSIGPTGGTGGHRVGFGISTAKNVGGDLSNLAGQYVGPNDMRAHQLIPGYIPRQDLQNAIRQDPLASLLGPMQKPAPDLQPQPPLDFDAPVAEPPRCRAGRAGHLEGESRRAGSAQAVNRWLTGQAYCEDPPAAQPESIELARVPRRGARPGAADNGQPFLGNAASRSDR